MPFKLTVEGMEMPWMNDNKDFLELPVITVNFATGEVKCEIYGGQHDGFSRQIQNDKFKQKLDT
jgi:hypothetical protein